MGHDGTGFGGTPASGRLEQSPGSGFAQGASVGGAEAQGGDEMALATNDLKVISQSMHAVGKFSSKTSSEGVCRMGVSAWLSRLELALQSYFLADLNFVDYNRLWRIVFHLLDERA